VRDPERMHRRHWHARRKPCHEADDPRADRHTRLYHLQTDGSVLVRLPRTSRFRGLKPRKTVDVATMLRMARGPDEPAHAAALCSIGGVTRRT